MAEAAMGGAMAGRQTGVSALQGHGSNGSAYSTTGSSASVDGVALNCLPSLPLAGRRLEVAYVQQMLDYERGNDLELWELWAD